MKQTPYFIFILLFLFACQPTNQNQKEDPNTINPSEILISAPMTPPSWAVKERELLALYDAAASLFAGKFVADNGYLKVVERWGGNDGPDDAMENFSHWPLVYALGGPEALLDIYQKAWNGHLIQYTNASIPTIEMAKDGMYHKEFITSFDWEHTGEGLSAFNFYSLINPEDAIYKERLSRFAGFYMNEDPEAPNYDPEHKIIRSLHNGSRGPKLTNASEIDWGGEPVEGAPERLSRYSTAGNIKGDHPLNLLSTTLAMNAFMATGQQKYKDWVLEYTGAWKDRVIENGGNIPSNIGLDGKIGGEWDGKWYGGTFGWNFWPQSNTRNYSIRGVRVSFGNAFMLTQDKGYVDALRRQIQNLYDAKKVENGTILLPNKYGDEGWYGYIKARHFDVLRDIYLWTMDSTDLQHLENDPWISFLLGKNPSYPEEALQSEIENVHKTIAKIHADDSKQASRQTDDIQRLNPIKAGTLVKLTTGGNDPGNAGNILHCRVRYFDPAQKRPGLPPDVGALVQKVSADGISLTLVNLHQNESRDVSLLAGAYGEHQFEEIIWENQELRLDSNKINLTIAPGCGAMIQIKMKRYANSPKLFQPE